MATFRWRANFLIPGLPLAQPVRLGAIHVAGSTRDGNRKYESTGHLIFEADQFLFEAEARGRAAALLEPVAVAGAALGGSIGEPVVTLVNLENRDALEAAGVRIPFEGGLLVTWTVGTADIDCASLTKGYLAVLGLGPQEAPLWHRAARWLWKSNWEADPYDQFLALWIAFNVLYGPRWTKGTNTETGTIEAYLAEAVPWESDAKALLAGVLLEDLQLLGASGLTLWRSKKWAIANELQAALALPEEARSFREVIRLVCLVIYSIRCDIVHEGGVSVPKDDLRLLWSSRNVLKTVVMFLIKRRLGL